jgi:ribosomal protein S14
VDESKEIKKKKKAIKKKKRKIICNSPQGLKKKFWVCQQRLWHL